MEVITVELSPNVRGTVGILTMPVPSELKGIVYKSSESIIIRELPPGLPAWHRQHDGQWEASSFPLSPGDVLLKVCLVVELSQGVCVV
eukprot:m.58270 g.58270  ORF g.58270 m.58270 type:complete len:88 (+) comp11673_c0_seq2:76-339(+)